MDTKDGNSRETVLAHKGEVIRVIANSDGSSLTSLLSPDAAYKAGMALIRASEQARAALAKPAASRRSTRESEESAATQPRGGFMTLTRTSAYGAIGAGFGILSGLTFDLHMYGSCAALGTLAFAALIASSVVWVDEDP